MISVILINYNCETLVIDCLNSFYIIEDCLDVEFIIVHNGGNLEKLKQHFHSNSSVHIIDSGGNIGFSKGNNLGLKHAKGEYILYLNSDTLFIEPILKKMQEKLNDESIGIVGCQLRNIDLSLQLSYHEGDLVFTSLIRRNPLAIKFFNSTKKIEISKEYNLKSHCVEHEARWLSGACVLLKQSAIIDNNWFWDEDFFMYWEDVELCYRISKAGKKILYLPNLTLIHIGGGGETNFSFKRFSLMEQSKLMFIEKTSGKWKRNLYTFLMRQEIRFERFLEQKKAKNRSLPILEKEIEFYLQEKKS